MDSSLLIAFVLTAGLAYANGANDLSKGISTLVGSGVTNYNRAILWGTVWTFLGSLLAVFVSTAMVKTFTTGVLANSSGTMIHGAALAYAVLVSAVFWVLFATRTGLPVSTTHAITGALCGAGVAAMGFQGILWDSVFTKIALPLAVSPFIALAFAYLVTPSVRWSLERWKGHCLCVFPVQSGLLTIQPDGAVRMTQAQTGVVTTVDDPACDAGAEARVLALRMGPDTFHWLTSGLTSLARGINDTPKIVALMAGYLMLSGTTASTSLDTTFLVVAGAMTVGAYLSSRKVTVVLAEKVTRMDHMEGFSANLTTSLLVTVAARFGLPVSTTHVSSGATIGIGFHNGVRQINWKTVAGMVGAWIITLPVCALVAALAYGLLSRMI